MRLPTTSTLTGKQLLDWMRPCVYAWRRNGQWLYVGQSVRGLSRLGGHHAVSLNDILPTDELLMWHVDHAERIRLEAELIVVNRPLYNRTIPSGNWWEPQPEKPKKPARKGRPTAAEMKEYKDKSARPRIGPAISILRTREIGTARTHAHTSQQS